MVMGVIGRGRGCAWVRARLPLLCGGELSGPDRREVERHLIGCPGCRGHAASLAGAQGALRAAAGWSAGAGAEGNGPSLWPALARQIRESRHAPAAGPW